MKRYYSLLLFLFILTACSTSQKTAKPVESYTATPYVQPVSNISIPVSVKEASLVSKINKQLNGVLYQDDNLEDDNLMLKVWKQGDIDISLNGNNIDYKLPLRIWVKTGVTKWGMTLAQDMEIQFSLKYHTSFTIAPNWELSTVTTSAGYEWLADPYIDIKGIKIPVKTIASAIINHSQDRICKEIDNQVKQNINLKKYLEQAWAQIQQPILLNPTYHVWLQIQPKELGISPFTNNLGTISSSIGIKAITEIFISLNTPASTGAKPLPTYKSQTAGSNSLQINLGIDLPYAEAEALAKQSLLNKTFEDGKRKVTIQDIKLYGSNGKSVLALSLTGSYTGKIYLMGIPDYSKETKTIFIKDIDYSLESKNMLFKSASWLFKSTIVHKVAESAKFPVASYLSDAMTTANGNLNSNTTLKNIVINGKITNVDVDQISLSPQSFKMVGVAEGRMTVGVEGLDF